MPPTPARPEEPAGTTGHEPASSVRRSPAGVPWPLDLAAAWSWRLIVVGALGWVLLRLVAAYSLIALSLAVAVLLAALADPAVRRLARRMPRGAAALLVVVLGAVVVVALLAFVGRQVAGGAGELVGSVARGVEQVRTWLVEGPLDADESQIDEAVGRLRDALGSFAGDGALEEALALGYSAGNAVVGFLLTVVTLFFLLADGTRIWGWTVSLAPRAARERVDSSGRVAWGTLHHYVRATVAVALADAVGITLWAAVLGVPFLAAIFVLTFLGAFVPVVGATLAGAVAVLVALVDGGPTTALLMLLGVLVVQQVESNLLQPFLMGRLVALHPLGVLLAVTAGGMTAGIAGALVAVPLVATANAVVLHLAGRDPTVPPPDDPPEDDRPEDDPPDRRRPDDAHHEPDHPEEPS